METGNIKLVYIAVFYVFFGLAFGYISWEAHHNRRGLLFRILWPLSVFSDNPDKYGWGLIELLNSKRVYMAVMAIFWSFKLIAMAITGIVIPVVFAVVAAIFLFLLWLSIPKEFFESPPATSEHPPASSPAP